MDKIKELLNRLAPIIKESEEQHEKRMDTGFNLFYLISDHYYRETFHSDIIAALLSPKEKHGGGNLYLNLFLDMIGVDKSNYQDAKVHKEYGTNDGTLGGRIDIFIEGENNHCVVVENKLNDAGDTYRQLPKYYQYLKKKKYIIDKFVYLPLNPYKTPDKSDWSDEERKNIDDKLIIIPAYQEGRKNLIDNWLEIAEEETKTKNEDAKVIIKQYRTVLHNLTIDIMSTMTLDSFYCELLKDDNLETVLSIRKMLDDLPHYLASRILEKYSSKCNPFDHIWTWPQNQNGKDAVFEGAVVNGIYLKIDIICDELGYDVWFNNPTQHFVPEQKFASLVESINSLADFEVAKDAKNRVTKHFAFTDEKGLCDFIDAILPELTSFIKK